MTALQQMIPSFNNFVNSLGGGGGCVQATKLQKGGNDDIPDFDP